MGPQDPPRRLGRGLDALLARRETRVSSPPVDAEAQQAPSASGTPTVPSSEATDRDNSNTGANGEQLRTILITHVRPNPYQPRKEFRAEELADLEASLSINGLLQPINVRPAPSGNGYELIAGERRFRAATNLGWKEIPAIVRNIDDKDLLTLAMIENLQRSDLDPIEEADGYQRLVDEFSLSQQEVAAVVGKNRTTITNALRLLNLPATVRRMLQEKQLSAGHARALLSLSSERAITELAREIVNGGMSVREVEKRVRTSTSASTPAKTASDDRSSSPAVPRANAAHLRRIEELLKRRFQTGAAVNMETSERGHIKLAFFSSDDLERLLEQLGINPEH